MTGNMIGRIFNNRYKLTERIGIGGMAEVFRAQDMTLSRLVAVKVMLPQYAADPSFTQRFRQEAAAAANLQSPFVVNVYDWGKDGDTYFIVMEYVRGSDLKTAIKERGAINQRKVAEIGSQVCQALSVAHKLDIIHRDIKPQNIMIQPDGNAKVMDFGIAHAKNSVMDQTSSVLGTAHYVSPEQAQGKELTASSDMYSLGVVLYEAATGKLPFDGPDAVSVAMKQVQETPVLPSSINPDIDPAFEAIIMRALEKDPAARFATANDMRHALNDYLMGRKSSSFTQAQTSVLPYESMGGAASSHTEVMPRVSGEDAYSNKGSANRYIADNNQAKPKKRGLGLAIALIAAVLAICAGVFAFTQFGGLFAQGENVPDLVNMDEKQAEQVIRNAGFNVGTITVVKSDKVEEGKVVSQDPAAGTSRPKGSRINLNVSGGESQVVVPDLHGLTADEAQRALDSAGLKSQVGAGEYSDQVALNRVVRQDQPAGTRIAKGSTVTFNLSLGAETLEVPDVTNYSESAALSALQSAGFKVSIQRTESTSVEKGYVMSYSPSGKADKGSTVTVVVSAGKPALSKPTRPSASGTTGSGDSASSSSDSSEVSSSGSGSASGSGSRTGSSSSSS